ncbi:UvrD-helicase domain-containing protein [soil metagenome]
MSTIPLNPAQKRAVEHELGALLVLAGAGSGKNRVITERIARLMSRGFPARSIVALTFTNKAAGEMAERIHKLAKARSIAAKDLTVSTFHSFGLMVLSRERASLGGTFTIFDQGDALGALKEAMRNVDAGKRFDAPAILSRISMAKNAFLTPEDLAAKDSEDAYDEITRIVYPKYQAALRNFHAFDFDDLVCEVAHLFKTRADILERWQERYRFVLVAEYQDTNRAQLELLRLLADKHKNVCVVCDDDQSIYAWRGADVRNILDFEEHFPGAAVVKLEQNYRSRAPVLAVANAVISKRQDSKHRKVLFTDKMGGEKVRIAACASPDIEAAWVAGKIHGLLKDRQVKAREVAVLYRSNGQAKVIEEALREQGVAYRLVGGQQFFERKEVKDLLSYLKLALNRADEIALRRIVNYPARGIGDTSIQQLTLHSTARSWSLWQAVERVDALDEITGSARDGCHALEKIIGNARRALLVDRKRASEVARVIAEEICLRADIDASSPSPQAAARRWGNVESLFSTFTKREARVVAAGQDPTGEQGLASFLHALTLQFDDDEGDEKDKQAVTLSTLHGSKGLEFDHVFLIGCEEGYLPHTRTLETRANDASQGEAAQELGVASDIEEERRLLYVGVTRAREELSLTRCLARTMRGKSVPRTPSRFLLDIPEELVVHEQVTIAPHHSPEAMTEQANALLSMLEGLR